MATVQISLRIEKKFLEQFDNQTSQKGYDRAEAVRESMRRFIKNKGGK